MTPLANAFLDEDDLRRMEPFYPLKALVCERCFLVQLEEIATPEEIFSNYAYFSSYSTTWLDHARAFAEMATERFGLGSESRVIEVASNDGYLLQYFAAKGIPVLGVEPAANVAAAAESNGIPTLVRFFGRETADDLARAGLADLLVGNNVLPHVPDVNEFVAGLARLLAPNGTATLEFPHLLRLIEQHQFDTIYHEHFSYFSLLAARRLFAEHGLEIVDVDELSTHGGSLRVYARHAAAVDGTSERVEELVDREGAAGLEDLDTYLAFAERVKEAKREILSFFVESKRAGKSIVCYGAAAKGNTLLNFCGVGSDFIDYVVDRSPHKQGRYLPGTHIHVRHPDEVRRTQPDIVFILAWNLQEEIGEQMDFVREWGGVFAVPAPEVGLIR
jgi:SAM-dependent methyltransferase